jgi:hypothetical protein
MAFNVCRSTPESAEMKCLRIYANHEEVGDPDAVPLEVSASYQASRVRLTRIPAGMREVAWHTVPG